MQNKTDYRDKYKNSEKINETLNLAFWEYHKNSNLKTKTDTIGKLANETGLSEETIKNCLSGKYPVSYKVLKRLKEPFHLDLDALLYKTDDLNIVKKTIESIKKTFFSLELHEAFLLEKYYKTYIRISDTAFMLLEYYSRLNNNGKSELAKKIFESLPSGNAEDLLQNVNYVYDFQNMVYLLESEPKKAELKKFDPKVIRRKLMFSSKYLKSSDREHSIKKDLWNKLSKKIDDLTINDLLKFDRQAGCVFTMDSSDWKIVITFEMLSKKPLTRLSEEQQRILYFAEQLFEKQLTPKEKT